MLHSIDSGGRIQRSLAVSIDVTERLKAEEMLCLAKEELSLYSKELERQTSKRTSEITCILCYTPAVVYMKDVQGRYRLVNSRSEVDMLGLAGMSERASLVGGKLNMESRPGYGTCVRLTIPLKQHPGNHHDQGNIGGRP